MGDYMRPSDWEKKFVVTASGKRHLSSYGAGRTAITQFVTEAGYATRVLRCLSDNKSNHWISSKMGDSMRVARAITWLLNRGWIRRAKS